MLLVLLQYLLLASTFTIGKAALLYASPVFFIGVRMLIAGSLLLGYTYFFQRGAWRLNWQDWGAYIQLIFFHVYISFLAEFWALQYIPSSKACLLYNASPFVTALLAYLLLAEKLNAKKWLGLCIGITGILPILYGQSTQENIAGYVGALSLPEISLLISVCSSAYAWLLIKKLMRDSGYSILMLNGIAMFGGGVLAYGTALLSGANTHIACCAAPGDALARSLATHLGITEIGVLMFVLYLVALIIIANVLCFNIYGHLLRSYSATFLSFAGFTTPLFAALWGWLLLGETVGLPFIASFAGTFIGLYIFYKQELSTQQSAPSSGILLFI